MAVDTSVVTALMVEDNPADVALFSEAVSAAGVALRLHTVTDGVEVIEFLRRTGRHPAADRPDVVVLDLNLPLRNGKDVLDLMQRDPDLRTIPVVVLTTSKSESGITSRYTPGKCLYFAKTPEFGELIGIVRKIVNFAIANGNR